MSQRLEKKTGYGILYIISYLYIYYTLEINHRVTMIDSMR